MAKIDKDEMLKIVNDNISKIENKEFNVYFFVIDSKGVKTEKLSYIYRTALQISKEGYKVSMLHQEANFVGVASWMGEEYASLPHYNVNTDNVEVSPCDFIFIPEILSNILVDIKKYPWKKVVIVQDYDNICESMPVTATLDSLGVMDAVATDPFQANNIRGYFPNVRTHIVSPAVRDEFKPSKSSKKLHINIIAKDPSNIFKIVKPFYWRNPLYTWVTFKDLRDKNDKELITELQDNAVTIWANDDDTFGLTLLEALRCGNIVLAKIPNRPADWMLENNVLTESILWFDSFEDIHERLASVIRSWTLDTIPQELYEKQAKFNDLYSEERQKNEIKETYIKNIFERRLAEFKETKIDIEKGILK